MKRCLSLVLSLIILLGSVSVISLTASAEDYTLIYSISNGNATITGLSNPSYSGDVVIPETIDGNKVTAISSNAFYGCSSLQSITLPKSLTSTGYECFYGCTGLKSTYYNGSIEDWIKISFASYGNPIQLSHNLYIDGSQVVDLVIPEGVTTICADAFYGCSSLQSITLPKSITSTGYECFYGCTGLKYSYYNGSVEDWIKINFASYGNPIQLSHNLYIDGSQIVDLVIPEGVTTICADAFYGCSSLQSITLPKSITSTGYECFYGCTGLKYSYYKGTAGDWVNISFSSYGNPIQLSHNLYIDGNQVVDLVIPEGVTSISSYSFYGCSSLKSVTLPSTLTKIDYAAFNGCNEISDVYYAGSVTNYSQIAIASGNASINSATKHFGLSVNLISNGNSVSSGSYQSGDTFTFPADPTRTGYKFNGWNTSADGTGATYNAGDEITITEAVTFYALWECLHQLGTETKRVEPTCTEEGNTGNTVCKECGAILSTGEVIKAKGHTASAPVKENVIAATCTAAGSNDEVIYCADCGAEMSRKTETVSALGHNWTHTEAWSSDFSKCTIIFECKNDASHVKVVTCDSTEGIVSSPTCTEDGVTIYTVSYNDGEFTADAVKKVTIPATGHSYVAVVTKAATCTETGITTYTCKCGASYTTVINKLNHEDQNNDGKCDACGTVTDTNKYNQAQLKNAAINAPSGKTVNSGMKVSFSVTADNLPEGYSIAVYDGKTQLNKGDNKSVSYTSNALSSSKTYTVVVIDSNNSIVSTKAQNKTITVNVDTGFFAKIISFFSRLFGNTTVNL